MCKENYSNQLMTRVQTESVAESVECLELVSSVLLLAEGFPAAGLLQEKYCNTQCSPSVKEM